MPIEYLTKPAAFVMTAAIAGHSLSYLPCEAGKECPKSKPVPISLSFSAGTATSMAVAYTEVMNPIQGPAITIAPAKKPDWSQGESLADLRAHGMSRDAGAIHVADPVRD